MNDLVKIEDTKQNIQKKATLQDFLEKKIKKEEKKNSTVAIYVKSMDRTITLKMPSEERLYTYANDLGDREDLKVIMDANRKLIYDCCPDLQSTELHEALDIKDPYDTPKVLFDVNEVKEIMNEFNKFIGDKNVDEDIKN